MSNTVTTALHNSRAYKAICITATIIIIIIIYYKNHTQGTAQTVQ